MTNHTHPVTRLFPYPTLFRSGLLACRRDPLAGRRDPLAGRAGARHVDREELVGGDPHAVEAVRIARRVADRVRQSHTQRVLASGDRKSTRLNSSHVSISYAVF